MTNPPHAAPPGPLSPDDEVPEVDAIAHFLRLVGILRRRWLILLAFAILGLVGAALALRVLDPQWRARASIVLHASGPQVLDKVQGVGENAEDRSSGYREYYQTQRTILRSRAVAQRALDELGLATDPQFLGVDHISDPDRRQEEIDEIDPVERLREIVSVEEVHNSRVVEISALYPDPSIAAEIANAVTDAYIEHVQNSRSRVGEEAKDNISSERDKAMARLREAEQDLEAFKNENAITSISLSDRQNVITQDILTLSVRAKEAEAERIRLDHTLEQVQELHRRGNLAASTLIPEAKRVVFEEMRKELLGAEAEFRTVDVEFGPKHAEHRKAKGRLDLIQARIDREAEDLVESFASQREAAARIEHDLEQSLRRENQKALRLGTLERAYRELERESKVAAEDYLVVRRRDTEIAITNRVEDEGIEILDRAFPPSEPEFPSKAVIVALALVAGLCVGSFVALSIDFRDQRIRGLLDVERSLAPFGIPVLGQLPVLAPDSRLGVGNARAQRRQRDLYAHLFPQSLMAERCRGLRTSIAFVRGSNPAKTLMVTSPSSSEGKSSTAMNLALSFCQAKKRVLLVDADMRRPRLHQMFDTPALAASKGLSAVLAGEISVEQAWVAAPDDAPDHLWLLPCGEVPENPAELLDSPSSARTLAELRERFDIVILDTPPILPVADSQILASRVDGVVVVTRCDQTTRIELQRGLSLLVQGDANVLGVVVNEIDGRGDGYGYRSSYYTYRAGVTGSDAS